jgi:serine/threonine protein kinase
VKPSNILLGENDLAKVGDFGLVRPAVTPEQLTSPGVAVGTPVYMSPEQQKGLQLDHRSDLFSLGLALFEALSGTSPAPGWRHGMVDYDAVDKYHRSRSPSVILP